MPLPGPAGRRRRHRASYLVSLCIGAGLSLGLSGCVFSTTAVVAGANIVSYVETEKLLTDHAVSLATGMDCSAERAVREYEFCRDPAEELAAAEQDQVFCYRSLADITCYSEPDPYRGPPTNRD